MVCFSFSVHISVILSWVIFSTAMFFLSSSSSSTFSLLDGLRESKATCSTWFDDTISPLEKNISLFPAKRPYYIFSPLGWMDMMKLSVGLLERPLYLIIDSICVCVYAMNSFFILCVS